MLFSFILFALTYHVCRIECGKILFLPTIFPDSSKKTMAKWADALAERGHEIYWWAPCTKLDKYQPKNATYVDHFSVTVEDRNVMDMYVHENISDGHNYMWTGTYAIPFIETLINFQITPFCESIAKNNRKSFQIILSKKYDLVIMDEHFNGFGYVLSQLIDSPVAVYTSTCRLTATATRFNNVPISPAYTPPMGHLSVLSSNMNFWQRMQSTVSWWTADIGNYVLFKLMTNTMKKHFSEVQDITKSMQQPRFQFLCVNQQFEFPTPILHNLIYIGGIQMWQTVPTLPDEWQSFVDSAKNGFIILAMGHWAKWRFAPAKIKRAVIEAFKRIPNDYSIIWQNDDDTMTDLQNNTKQSNWLPLMSLLAHPKCKLFITHAGCNSVTESLYHAVPMIAIPLAADQPDVAVRIEAKGLGIVLKKQDVTADSLLTSIMAVLTNKSYAINVQKYFDTLKSDLMTPTERAVFWSEFAMRHKRGSYNNFTLSPTSSNWIKFYYIDLIFFCFICYLLFMNSLECFSTQ